MKKSVVICLLLLICRLAFSQEEFKAGFIIDNSGEYTYGYVKQAATVNSLQCVFKETESDQPKEYNPNEISGYGFLNANAFISRQIVVYNNHEKHFIELLAEGQVNLYFGLKRTFIEKGDNFQEISSEVIDMATLSAFMTDCSGLISPRKKIIGLGNLTRVIKSYNQCVSTGVVPESPLKTPALHFELFTGLDNTSLVFSANVKMLEGGKKFTDRTLVTGGVNVIFFLKNLEWLSVQTGGSINRQKFYLVSETILNNNNQEKATQIDILRINSTDIRIPVSIRINFLNKSRFCPYLKFGRVFSMNLQNGSTWNQRTGTSTSIYIENYDFLQTYKEPNSWSISIGTSIGLSKKLKVFAEVNRSAGDGSYAMISPAVKAYVDSRIMNINVGIRLK
jgi:hypothetical protein